MSSVTIYVMNCLSQIKVAMILIGVIAAITALASLINLEDRHYGTQEDKDTKKRILRVSIMVMFMSIFIVAMIPSDDAIFLIINKLIEERK